MHTVQTTMIWSGEHKAFWRAGGNGHTNDICAAGRWTISEAKRLTASCGPQKQIKLIEIASEWIDGVKV